MIEIRNFHFSSSSQESLIRVQAPQDNINSSVVLKIDFARPEYLSVKQFADSCTVTTQAVRKMISERRLEAVKMGKQYVIPYGELNRYLSIR
jgi:excisionase family DNA binding protein